MRKKLLALVMVLGLLGSAVHVLAAEEPAVQPVPAWAYGVLADGYAMGLFGDDLYTSHSQPVTQEQVDALAQADYATTIIPSKQASDALRRRGWYYFDPRYSVPYTFCVATLKHAYISMAAQKLLDMLYELRGTF